MACTEKEKRSHDEKSELPTSSKAAQSKETPETSHKDSQQDESRSQSHSSKYI